MSRDRDTWDPAASGPPISGPMGSDGRVESGAAVESGPGLTSGPDLVRPAASEVADDARYARDGTLGRGGMGVVYLAHDRRLGRAIALKEAARGGEVARRLQREAKVTASLEHPGIVTVHDSGLTAAGRPFYTMRLLRGRPFSAAIAEQVSLEGRLGLLRRYLDACNAVAYAHAEGVVHRDLKPANIMVGGFGETQVVDWGLAARVGGAARVEPAGGEVDGDPTATRSGAVLGTPAYMSPEQARGEPVGPAADVWSLGAILYELLSGRLPRERGSSDEVLARAREGEVPSPLGLEAPPELVAIAERALALDVADRYPDAAALAADVAAYLDGRRVGAHEYSPLELLRRLVRAWRAPLLVGALAALALLASIAWSGLRLQRESERVAAAERETRSALEVSDENLSAALVAESRTALRGGSTAVAAVLASHAITLTDAPEAWGVLAGVAVESRSERLSQEPLPACNFHALLGEAELLCIRSDSLSLLHAGEVRWSVPGAFAWVRAEGQQVVAGQGPTQVNVYDLGSGRALDEGLIAFGLWGRRTLAVDPAQWGIFGDTPAPLVMAPKMCGGAGFEAFSPMPRQGAYAVVCDDGRIGAATMGQYPTRYLEPIATYAEFSGVLGIEPTPDGRGVVFGGAKGDLAVVDLERGLLARDRTAGGEGVLVIAISADGSRVALAGDRGDVEVHEIPGLGLLARLPASLVRDLLFLPDGTLLVADGTTLSRWRLPKQRTPGVFRARNGVTAAIFSPDGSSLATAHGREQARILELPSGRLGAALDIGTATAKGVAFSPDGSTAWFSLVGAEVGGTWRPEPLRLDGGPVERLSDALVARLVREAGFPPSGAYTTRRIGVLKDGTLIGLSYVPGVILTIDTLTHTGLSLEGCPAVEWFDLGQAPGGEAAALVGEGGVVTVIRPEQPLRCRPTFTVDDASAVDVDASGDRLIVATSEVLSLYDAAGVERWRVAHPTRIYDVSISADGRWVATGGGDHNARLYDGATGALRAIFPGHTERVSSVDLRADGRLLATGSWDGTARLWGLDVLDVPAEVLDQRAEADWGLSLAEALAAAGR